MKKLYAKLPAVFLVAVGSLTMTGDLLGLDAIKGLGLASHASPAPKVFTSHQGFETFSPQFELSWQDLEGRSHQKILTREQYKNLSGPYNRRNAYGAAISYGPILSANPKTKGMLESASHYAFCGDGNLISELMNSTVVVDNTVKISILPRPSQQVYVDEGKWQLEFEINCMEKDNRA